MRNTFGHVPKPKSGADFCSNGCLLETFPTMPCSQAAALLWCLSESRILLLEINIDLPNGNHFSTSLSHLGLGADMKAGLFPLAMPMMYTHLSHQRETDSSKNVKYKKHDLFLTETSDP